MDFVSGTKGKLLRRLKYIVQEGDGVLRRTDPKGNPLVLPKSGADGPIVIDLFGIRLTPSLQRFVVAAVFHQLVLNRSGNTTDGLRYLVTLDELNRFAPKNSSDPITQQIEQVAAEMRSQGVILLGAQQQASLVSPRVIENAGIRAVGRSGTLELSAEVWKVLAPAPARRPPRSRRTRSCCCSPASAPRCSRRSRTRRGRSRRKTWTPQSATASRPTDRPHRLARKNHGARQISRSAGPRPGQCRSEGHGGRERGLIVTNRPTARTASPQEDGCESFTPPTGTCATGSARSIARDDLTARVEVVADLCEKHKVDVLLIAGDLFSEQATVEDMTQALTHLHTTFASFFDRGGTILAVTGNHDKEARIEMLRAGMRLAAPAAGSRQFLPGRMYMLNRPYFGTLQTPAGDRAQFVLIPYPTTSRYAEHDDQFRSKDEENRVLQGRVAQEMQIAGSHPEFDQTLPTILAAHLHVRGAESSLPLQAHRAG